MKLILPLAGEGKRMRPLSLGRPKPLIHVAGKPLLFWIYETFGVYDLQTVVPVVSPGKMGERIVAWSRAYWEERGVKVIPAVQEEPLGLGHAVLVGLEALKEDLSSVLIALGDTLFDLDLREILARGVNFIGVREVEDPRRFGVVWTDAEGRITELEEKPENPTSNLAIVGIYYFTQAYPLKEAIRTLMQWGVKTRGEYQLTDALELLVEQWNVPLYAQPVEGWHDAGVPETLLKTHELWCERHPHIGDNVIVRGRTKIFPPVVIPDGVVLEDVEIGPFVSVGEGSVLERSRIRHAVLHENVHLLDAELEYALVGGHVHIRELKLTGLVGDYTSLARKKTGPSSD